MSVYRLTKSDTDIGIEVTRLFFDREATKQDVNNFLSDENNYLLIYRYKDDLAGFAYGFELQRFDGRKNMIYLHQVEVLPKFRQLGIGKELMEAFIEICKDKNCSRLFLITNKSNEQAVALYNSVGGRTLHDDDVVYSFPF
ncbi:MAG: GNAT family N-acetyltransferase [Anaerobacillus sp.]|uniref:GNAT family N-acetyltransferase n=1 Tax=Anaerobacillus sp. TaxID=1872506 RepID=UPI00391A826F